MSPLWAQAQDFDDREYHASQARAQQECSASQKWDSARNMCVTTVDSKKRRDDVRQCSEIEDDAARKACHDQIAARETGVSKGDEYSDKGAIDMSIPVMAAGLSGTMMLAAKKKFSSCSSLKVMAGTSAIGLASEFFYKSEAKKSLEKMQKDYKRETASDQAYPAQKRAFEYLKKEQELIAEFEEKRRNTMYVMTAGFSLATILALTKDNLIANCGTGEKVGEDEEPPEEETGNEEDLDWYDELKAKSANFINKNLSTPRRVALASGVAGIATMALGAEAAKQVRNADENAKTVQSMIEKFDADFKQFCPKGREDMSDPGCFCYTEDGDKNPDRSNSQTCQQYWAQNDKNLFVEAGDYSRTGKKGPAKGCAFLNGDFDKDCKCRKMKNKDGENACLKVGVPSSVAANLSGAVPLPQILGNLNGVAQGGIGQGVFDPDQLADIAQATNKAARQVLEKDLQDNSNGKAPTPEQLLATRLNDIPDAAVKDINNFTGGGSTRGLAALTRPQTPEFTEALKKAGVEEDSEGLESSIGITQGSDLRRGQKDGEDEEDYFGDWGDSSNSGGSGQELTFMDKKYQYQQNDIVERDDISLWEIISQRYTKTGLRRLFPDEDRPLEDLN